MCGIIGGYVYHPQRVKGHVTNILEHQKSRGLNGFGLGIRKQDGTLLRYRCEERAEIFNCSLWDVLERGDNFIFHHRTPTSTPNVRECNHPIMNETKDMMMIHNGIISKPNIEQEHEYETMVTEVTYVGEREIYRTERVTDSEWALHRLEELLENGNIGNALQNLGGEHRSSFLFLFKEYDGIIWLARNYPLWMYKYGGNVYVSSLKALITSDKNLDKTVTKDLDPAYGGITVGEIDFIVEKSWVTTYTNNYAATRTQPVTYGMVYQKYQEEFRKGTTELLYKEWLDVLEELKVGELKLDNTKAKLFTDDDFKDFLPPNMSIETHLKLHPDCDGVCDECNEFGCYNNPIQQETGIMAFYP